MGKGDRKRILIVDNSVALTGALKAIVNSTYQLQEKFEFLYVLPENSAALPYLEKLGLSYQTLPFVEINKKPFNLVKYFPYLLLNGLRLKKMAERFGASIIHMNDFYNLSGIAAKVLGSDIQLVTHVRFMPQKFTPLLANTWAKLNLRHASQVICVSEAVKRFFPASAKIVVIPDAVPEREEHPPKEDNQVNPAEIKLLYLSNFIPGKGQQYALAAFKEAYKKNQRLRLIFAGHDMGLEKNKLFKQALQKDVLENNLGQVISFESFVEDVEAKMKTADIFLNFSESESFSLTCLDALFYGTPLIASDCGGPAELFEHGKSGFLVPNKNVKAMEEAIVNLASDRSLREKFSAEGKAFVRRKFGPENSYLRLKQLYLSLV